ncbi:MAG TPA: ABC transporter permease [Chitinophagaceae bacterium]|nr:ABC transporter permease [Chitinophagaceae bacterium]
MLKNYLKVALRNLWKNKAFSAINITGLSVGLAVCLLIVLYVKDELSYDKYNTNAENIYRLDADIYFNGTQFTSAICPAPLAPTLRKDHPEIIQYVRMREFRDMLVKKDNQNIRDHKLVFADSTFFRVFSIPMIAGNRLTALNEPGSIVISETTAKKYFSSTDVVGKILFVDNSQTCKVTGVFKDIPPQSHFHFNFIRPLHDTYHDDQNDWLSNNYSTYVVVAPGVTRQTLQAKVDATVNTYLGDQLKQVLHTSTAELKKGGNHFLYPVMPLKDIHLHSNKSYEFEANGSVTYVYIFSVIAVLILVIACVNFMNLSTAHSANRAKEVGIRKVAGSLRIQLITQFLVESTLLSFFSLVLALGIAWLLLPLFNQLAAKEMSVLTLVSSWLLPVLIVLIAVVGCIAGSYPAFYLSSFQPVQVLKGGVAKGFKNSWLRSGLVVFQFFISISLIIGAIVIYNQLNYIRSKEIGYNRDQVLVIDAYSLGNQLQTFRQQVLKIPGVQNATVAGSLPTETGFSQNGWFKDATLDAKQVTILTDFNADQDYIPTMGMQMAAGRNFSRNYLTDSSAVIINETAAKLLGFKDPLNEKLYRPGGYAANNTGFTSVAFHIIGVVKDFNFSTMHDKVGPLIIELSENYGKVAMRINTQNIPALIAQVKNKWNSMAPGQPFSYTFLDADFGKLYAAEQRTGKLFTTFAIFAIFIACLGLFGLVTYAAEQRIKEIGVRKVLGASVAGIVTMLSKDFAKLVLIASLIAFPVAWWAMNEWLKSFAYRITIHWWVFVVAGILTLIIALVTVSIQAVKAALANPVKSLRTQ